MLHHKDPGAGTPALNPGLWFTGRKGAGHGAGCKASSLCSGTKDEPAPIAQSICGLDNAHCQAVYVGTTDAACHLCTEHLQVFLARGGKIDQNSPPPRALIITSGAQTARCKESAEPAKEHPQTNTSTGDQPGPLAQQPAPNLGEPSKQAVVDTLQEARGSGQGHSPRGYRTSRYES